MDYTYTYQCDGSHCEHETDVRHQRGAGVYCEECAARRVKFSFDPEGERADQQAVRAEQLRTVPQT